MLLSSCASSSGRQPNFVTLNRGRHVYSAGRPSCWALAHILVRDEFLMIKRYTNLRLLYVYFTLSCHCALFSPCDIFVVILITLIISQCCTLNVGPLRQLASKEVSSTDVRLTESLNCPISLADSLPSPFLSNCLTMNRARSRLYCSSLISSSSALL